MGTGRRQHHDNGALMLLSAAGRAPARRPSTWTGRTSGRSRFRHGAGKGRAEHHKRQPGGTQVYGTRIADGALPGVGKSAHGASAGTLPPNPTMRGSKARPSRPMARIARSATKARGRGSRSRRGRRSRGTSRHVRGANEPCPDPGDHAVHHEPLDGGAGETHPPSAVSPRGDGPVTSPPAHAITARPRSCQLGTGPHHHGKTVTPIQGAGVRRDPVGAGAVGVLGGQAERGARFHHPGEHARSGEAR